MGGQEESQENGEERYFVYQEPLVLRLLAAAGWILGWGCYWLARLGFVGRAEALIDDAIVMRRSNPGAVRAIGYLNGLRGLSALRRGKLLIRGRIHDQGRFAKQYFFSTSTSQPRTRPGRSR